LLVPVPSGTSNIRNLFNWGEVALSILQIVSFIARLAGSSIVESSALIRYRNTNSVFVEHPVV